MLRLALYQGAAIPPQHGYHAGLRFTKFFDRWADASWDIADGDKQQFLNGFRSVGDTKMLEEAHRRLEALRERQGGHRVTAETAWRLTSGLGYDHPVENGFTWHHTLGVPYIPGSSVKGTVRAFAKQWADIIVNDAKHQEKIDKIFGSPNKVGSVLFLDALPRSAVKLEVDIMTPHYSPWYSGEKYSAQDGIGKPDELKPPADWHNPTPIPFLTVAPKSKFSFYLLPREPNKDDADADVRQALDWLKQALEYTGIGAKTAVGYGRFE
jgi:CRISPR-associated protein Cmr6